MSILVTPRSPAEVNQLASIVHSAGYTHYAYADNSKTFKVGVPAIFFPAFEEYCHKAAPSVVDDVDNTTVLTVNDLGTLLLRS